MAISQQQEKERKTQEVKVNIPGNDLEAKNKMFPRDLFA